MKIFIDTANLQEIKAISELGIVDGVTTNPTLMAREKIKSKDQIVDHFSKISDIINGDISVEVLSLDYEGMIKEALEYIDIASNIVIKLPATYDGVRAVKYLSAKGIKTNCTLIFSVEQALLAMKAGASYISPFVGRLEDNGIEGLSVLKSIITIKNNYSFNTEIIATSIRNKYHLSQCLEFGADIVTCTYSFILNFFDNHLTSIGLNKFMSDFENQ